MADGVVEMGVFVGGLVFSEAAGGAEGGCVVTHQTIQDNYFHPKA